MKLFKILTKETEYIETISRSVELCQSKPGSAEHEELQFLLVLIKDYEFRKMEIPVFE
ncbi:hypothetical protein GZH53_00540 [Flavihumibacter sp. R14]|nr:hypothetical protein [Flavihumibacter soli]